MSVREATHASSWYKADPKILSSELDNWLAQVPAAIDHTDVPIPGARLIIAPHAGYSYSGRAAAWAYKCLDLSKAKRVFILGPNHQSNYGLYGLALSSREYYATPFGNLRLDLATIAELRGKSGIEIVKKQQLDEKGVLVEKDVPVKRGFSTIPKRHEDDEHSLEMHLPYIYKMMSRVFDNPENFPPIIPIMVGGTNDARERIYGKILAPYLKNPDSVFIVSSDFCHWGGHFHYHYYLPASTAAEGGYTLDPRTSPTPTNPPIHDSIRRLDKMGMDAVEEGSHQGFQSYLAKTHNTICGRHPIGVVMVAVEFIRNNAGKDIENYEIIETEEGDEGDAGDVKGAEKGTADKTDHANVDPRYGKFKFVEYDRSNLVVEIGDYSVSYASAYAVL